MAETISVGRATMAGSLGTLVWSDELNTHGRPGLPKCCDTSKFRIIVLSFVIRSLAIFLLVVRI